MTKKAPTIAGKQIQEHEYIYPYYHLEEQGYEVDVGLCSKKILGSKRCYA
jgi:hypothetical protein